VHVVVVFVLVRGLQYLRVFTTTTTSAAARRFTQDKAMKKQTRKPSQNKTLSNADLSKASGGLKPIGSDWVALKPIGNQLNIGAISGRI
jgi:hypothetical protein